MTTKGFYMSKKYDAAVAKIDKEKLYTPLEALTLVKEVASANFDETVEMHVRLGIDTRQADQQLRGTVSLPNGSGKTVRVAVFAEGDAAKAAEEAGADIVGSDELIADIQAGNINFDATVATPDQMAKVGRLGKILGTRGLMPNPKLGTVTPDVAKAIKELKGGRVEYRADRFGICHVIIGKCSFSAEQLAQNYGAIFDEIIRMKPAAAKGKYVKSVTVTSSMGPGVPVDGTITRDYDGTAE
jgi:large subunit ribosomal protein L1